MARHAGLLITVPPSDTKETRATAARPSPAVPALPHPEYDSEGCPRARRPVPRPVLHTQEPPSPRYCQKHKVHRSHSTTIFLVFMSFPSPYKQAAPIHKRRPPCQQSPHTRAAFPIRWRRSLIHFHRSHNPIRLRRSP